MKRGMWCHRWSIYSGKMSLDLLVGFVFVLVFNGRFNLYLNMSPQISHFSLFCLIQISKLVFNCFRHFSYPRLRHCFITYFIFTLIFSPFILHSIVNNISNNIFFICFHISFRGVFVWWVGGGYAGRATPLFISKQPTHFTILRLANHGRVLIYIYK